MANIVVATSFKFIWHSCLSAVQSVYFLHMFRWLFVHIFLYYFMRFCWSSLVQYLFFSIYDRQTIYVIAWNPVKSFENLRLVSVNVTKRWSLHYESHFTSYTTLVLSLLLLFAHCLFLVSAGAYSGHIEHNTHNKSKYKHVLCTVIVDYSFYYRSAFFLIACHFNKYAAIVIVIVKIIPILAWTNLFFSIS